MVRPPSGCLVQLTDAGMEQNLLAVLTRVEAIWVALSRLGILCKLRKAA
jgi:hypothetical protein